MNKSVRLIVFFLVLIIPMMTYSQIGIGTEKPTQELEIAGSIRIQDLEINSPKMIRQLKSDDNGNLISQEPDPERFYFKSLLREFMSQPIDVNINETKDLNVELTVDIEPKTSVIVVLMYNIPIYYTSVGGVVLPQFAGVQLFSSKSGNLSGGNRRFSFPSAYNSSAGVSTGMFIEGKYVDVINNESDIRETITYTIKGYTTGLATATSIKFSDVAGIKSFGVGGFSCHIFNKFL